MSEISQKKRGVFMTTYKKVVEEKIIKNRKLIVINLTPEFSENEKKKIKNCIQIKLYDVFCKYI